MSTQFPNAIDNFTNPTAPDKLNSPSHAAQHTNANDAIKAIETYLGTATNPAGGSVSARLQNAIDDVATAINRTDSLQEFDNNIVDASPQPWIAQVYPADSVVSYLGKLWLTTATTQNTQVPGTDAVWHDLTLEAIWHKAQDASGGVAEAVKDQNGGAPEKLWVGTQAQYDALPVKDSSTRYEITDGVGTPGPAGPKGDPGAQGIQGVQGIQGPAGPAGAKGDTGPAGPEGPKGDSGSGVVIKGTLAAGAPAPTTPAVGDMWIAGGALSGWVTAVTGDGVVYDGATWVNVGPIRGPAGPTGPAGSDGATGPKGDTGAQGPVGNTGPQGIQGPKGDTGATGPAGTTSWNGITDKPSTVAGYGISDVYTKTQSDANYLGKTAKAASAAQADTATSATSAGVLSNMNAGQPAIALWKGTQAEYDAIATKNANTWYAIVP